MTGACRVGYRVVANDLAPLHHEAYALQFGDVRQRAPATKNTECPRQSVSCVSVGGVVYRWKRATRTALPSTCPSMALISAVRVSAAFCEAATSIFASSAYSVNV